MQLSPSPDVSTHLPELNSSEIYYNLDQHELMNVLTGKLFGSREEGTFEHDGLPSCSSSVDQRIPVECKCRDEVFGDIIEPGQPQGDCNDVADDELENAERITNTMFYEIGDELVDDESEEQLCAITRAVSLPFFIISCSIAMRCIVLRVFRVSIASLFRFSVRQMRCVAG